MANRLASETSPYLRQHAQNPVDWFPWGEEAKARAKAEDKPILLSIGYSACHWCHVMERESFEDPATAELMNRDFINIKVDREERPDLDEIYMRAVQAFTGGHGGWPMTVFLHPDGRPFFGGTYFPPEPSRGLPSFRQIMLRATQLYRNDRVMLEKLSAQVLEAIESGGRMPAPLAPSELGGDWLDPLIEALEEDFDDKWGGFTGAPKFPPHGQLAAMLAHAKKTGKKRSLEMVTKTLDGMARGGMYDLIGGGFSRYSVDERWAVPHFEKMLYDNAQLVPLYLDAHALTGDASYAEIARETLSWVSREMTDGTGAFYSAQDADSEGVEGKFFAFTPLDVTAAVGPGDAKEVAGIFSVSEEGSFEHGTSVLRLVVPRRGDLSPALRGTFDRGRHELFAFRSLRVRPGVDDKIITAWNAMMISAFARAAQVLRDSDYIDAAIKAADHLLEAMKKHGRLLRTHNVLAFADDYILFSTACLDLYETCFDQRWLRESLRLAEESVRLFWDEQEGGFFLTGHDAETLVTRTKSFLSNATPSANGSASLLFARLAAISGRKDLGDIADRILRSYAPLIERAPRALGLEAIAGTWRAGGTVELGIAGGDPAFVFEAQRRYLPFKVLARLLPGDSIDLLPWMEGRRATRDHTTGYVCRDHACRVPSPELEAWKNELDALDAVAPRAPAGKGRVRAPRMPDDPSLWLNTDRPLELEDLRGNVVVLDFFTYCCINCMHVLPELEAIEHRFEKDPVVVIGVHSAKFSAEKEATNVRRAIHRHRIRHPVVLDSEHELWSEHAVNAWPTIVVLDPTGRVAWKKSGEVDREELGRQIARLLEEAREEHTLGDRLTVHSDALETGELLLFPGKVHVFPDAQHQSLGMDPFGPQGRLYIADSGHHRILEAALSKGADGWPAATLTRVFGTGEPGLSDGPPSMASFKGPQGIHRYQETLYVADTENHALRAIDLITGETTTLAGTGQKGSSGRGDPAKPKELALRSPWDVAGLEGGVFVAMAGTHQIWVYLPDRMQMGPMIGTGREAHVDGPVGEAALAQPSGLSLFGHLLFFADSETSSIRIADLRQNQVATVVGRGLFDFGDIDGKGEEVRLQHPLGVAAYESTVYVADTFNDKIKSINLDGAATTTLATGLKEPSGLTIAGDFLLIADTGNHRLAALHRKTGELRPLLLSIGA